MAIRRFLLTIAFGCLMATSPSSAQTKIANAENKQIDICKCRIFKIPEQSSQHALQILSKNSFIIISKYEIITLFSGNNTGKFPQQNNLTPYLIKGTGFYEDTGNFFASQIDHTLYVTHGSLGHTMPPQHAIPVLIFLETQIDTISANAMMAQ